LLVILESLFVCLSSCTIVLYIGPGAGPSQPMAGEARGLGPATGIMRRYKPLSLAREREPTILRQASISSKRKPHVEQGENPRSHSDLRTRL
jgi:hypothetical protein